MQLILLKSQYLYCTASDKAISHFNRSWKLKDLSKKILPLVAKSQTNLKLSHSNQSCPLKFIIEQ